MGRGLQEVGEEPVERRKGIGDAGVTDETVTDRGVQ
jgi:hypothetical protein